VNDLRTMGKGFHDWGKRQWGETSKKKPNFFICKERGGGVTVIVEEDKKLKYSRYFMSGGKSRRKQPKSIGGKRRSEEGPLRIPRSKKPKMGPSKRNMKEILSCSYKRVGASFK